MNGPLKRVSAGLIRVPQKICLGLIWVYQNGISPRLGANCRYRPTCSAYAREAIEKYGALKGCWLAARRIMRCHPWHPGGYDPVP